MKKVSVLVVDDDQLLRKLVTDQLSRSGFDASPAASGEEALASLQATDYDVVLLDIRMTGMTGLDTLREIRRLDDAPEVVMLTADTSLGTGLEAMRLGAYDYLTKPATLDEMEAVIRKAEEKRRLVRQNTSLRAARPNGADADLAGALVFASEQMRGLVQMAEQAARLDSTVVITGESGTGKDVLAEFIHTKSARGAEPMMRVNCGALPEQLFESEFFGHEKGAFTGATVLKHGLIEAAEGSTLFLDEIGELPAPMQVKLLHFLEHGRFRRVGSTRDRAADVRIIAATNRRLVEEVQQGRFRADLFYRLNVISLHVPPLRERPADIPALVEHFLALYRARFDRPSLSVPDDAVRRLTERPWHGNVRELRNSLERAAALSPSDVLEADAIMAGVGGQGLGVGDQSAGAGGWGMGVGEQSAASAAEDQSRTQARDAQPPSPNPHPPSSASLTPTLDEVERQHILRVLEETGGNRERAAAALGISSRTLYRKLREYGAGGGE